MQAPTLGGGAHPHSAICVPLVGNLLADRLGTLLPGDPRMFPPALEGLLDGFGIGIVEREEANVVPPRAWGFAGSDL